MIITRGAGARCERQCGGTTDCGKRRKLDVATTAVAYLSALGLQVGEFAVVWLAISDGLDRAEEPVSRYATWRAYGTYVVGYSLFGVLMAFYLYAINKHLRKSGTDAHGAAVDSFEKLYSWAGLVAKLGLLLSELYVHKQYDASTDGVLAGTILLTLSIIVAVIIIAGAAPKCCSLSQFQSP